MGKGGEQHVDTLALRTVPEYLGQMGFARAAGPVDGELLGVTSMELVGRDRGEQAGCANKALRGVDLLGRTALQGLVVGTALEDGLDGGVMRAVMRQGPRASRLQARGAIGLGQGDDALRGAQSFYDTVRQQALGELPARRLDGLGLLLQPLAVMGEEPLRLGRHVIVHRQALTRA